MNISTLRFGNLEIPDEKVITMAKPILGFEQLKKFCIIERDDCEPFLWYQSVTDPAVAFLIVNPIVFDPEYNIEVNPKELMEIKIDDVRTVETYVIVTIPQDPARMSVNMRGPILINTDNCLAKQLVMGNTRYRVKHMLLNESDKISIEKEAEPVEEALSV